MVLLAGCECWTILARQLGVELLELRDRCILIARRVVALECPERGRVLMALELNATRVRIHGRRGLRRMHRLNGDAGLGAVRGLGGRLGPANNGARGPETMKSPVTRSWVVPVKRAAVRMRADKKRALPGERRRATLGATVGQSGQQRTARAILFRPRSHSHRTVSDSEALPFHDSRAGPMSDPASREAHIRPIVRGVVIRTDALL